MRYISLIVIMIFSGCAVSAADPAIPQCPAELEAEERAHPGLPACHLHNYPTEGWVVVEFVVLSSGIPDDPQVIDSSHGMWNGAAVRAIKKYRYAEREAPCIRRERVTFELKMYSSYPSGGFCPVSAQESKACCDCSQNTSAPYGMTD